MRNRPALARTVLVAIVAAASFAGSTAAAAPTMATAPAMATATTYVKPIVRGLIDRQGAPATTSLGFVHAYVVKVNWADLQVTPGGPITPNNAIDQAIARVRQPDFSAVSMVLKLRVLAGINAPDWAKSLGGAPFPYVDNQDGASVTGGMLGRFWTPAFEAAYSTLQAKLAAKYDNVPEIREVTVSGCSTIFDEPFVRQLGDPNNVMNLISAGYTEDANRACIPSAIHAHVVWHHTTSDLDFSPMPLISSPDGPRDLPFTMAAMTTCRSVLGARCGLQNNALSSDKLADATFVQMCQQMTVLGEPLVFQTAAVSRLGDPQQVLNAAVAMTANSVELPQGYTSWSTPMLQDAATGLAANPVG